MDGPAQVPPENQPVYPASGEFSIQFIALKGAEQDRTQFNKFGCCWTRKPGPQPSIRTWTDAFRIR
jgi:hypothetical protein